ncbi:MAG TPA: efflux RND transporter periplasmic adaptor subunit, partial [Bacteroidia bacterium]|nr:efflux RND transporter periplasmic adaptor subunit [Bacteroidia bacterium]
MSARATPAAAPPPSAIPVIATKVVTRDVPIWLSGIGTVQGYNTVVVRPRVGGILEQIEFTEGSMVEKGDVLARIDPRPYEAALELATARKAQNEALLVSAQQDLTRMEALVKSQSVSQQALEQASALVAQLEAAIQADTASISSARLDLEYATVRAPISGRTGIRQVDVGNLVTANQTEGIVHLTQLQPVTVVFT